MRRMKTTPNSFPFECSPPKSDPGTPVDKVALPPGLDEPEHDHDWRRHQPEQPTQEQLEELRHPLLLVDVVAAAGDAQFGQHADGEGPEEDEAWEGHHEPSQGLLEQIGEEFGRLRLVEEEQPAEQGRCGGLAEVQGLDALLGQVRGDEGGLDEPGDEALDDDGDGCVTCQGVWQLEEADWLACEVGNGVHDWSRGGQY